MTVDVIRIDNSAATADLLSSTFASQSAASSDDILSGGSVPYFPASTNQWMFPAQFGDGRILVVWHASASSSQVQGRILNADGSVAVPDFVVADNGIGGITAPFNTAVTQLANGNVAVAFRSPAGLGIRIVDSEGHEVGQPADIGGHINYEQIHPLADGGFVVTRLMADYVSPAPIAAFAYDASGVFQGSFSAQSRYINEYNVQTVVGLEDGGWLYVWEPPGGGLVAQRFDAKSHAVGQTYAISETNALLRWTTDISATRLADGRVVVAWSDDAGGSRDIHTRILDATGTPTAPVQTVTTAATDDNAPIVTALKDGGYAVSWLQGSYSVAWDGGSGTSFHAQLFDADGRALGTAQHLGTNPYGLWSDAAASPDGGAVFTWKAHDSDGFGAHVAWLKADGTLGFSDLLLNAGGEAGNQYAQSLFSDRSGNVMAAWLDSSTMSGILQPLSLGVTMLAFEALPSTAQAFSSHVEGGFTISAGTGDALLGVTAGDVDGNTGSLAIRGAAFSDRITVAAASGKAFAVASLDVDTYGAAHESGTFTLSGRRADGGTVSQSFTTDDLVGAQTFRLGADFSRVVAISWQNADDRLFAIDNIEVRPNSLPTSVIRGDALANRVYGRAGDDHLFGLGGNDKLYGLAGADVLEGGSGHDRYDVDNAGDEVVEGAGQGYDVVVASVSYGLGQGQEVERLVGRGTAGLTLAGNAFANRIEGTAGDDHLFGLGGDDKLLGGAGTNTLEGGSGNDRYFVDSADDRVFEGAGQGHDVVTASVSYGLQQGQEIERLNGKGTAGLTLTGNERANRIEGTVGDDVLYGLDGDDRLIGNGGGDRIEGGGGKDRMSGGDGADTFVFADIGDSAPGATAWDEILNFTSGADRIDLSAIQAVPTAGSDQAFDFIGEAAFTRSAGQLRETVIGTDILLEGDVTGDGLADLQILLKGHSTFAAGDLIL